ncbi:MAG: hypothetical protein ABIP12_06545 [Terriglobales bacterium]
MRKRRIWLAAGVVVVILLIAGAVYMRKLAAPEVARLLPEGEGVVYISFSGFRLASSFGSSPVTLSREPEYEEFLRQTGFQFERDLDEIAIAIHPAEIAPRPLGPEMQRRYSQIFNARFDAAKLNHYLHKLASGVEKYRNFDVFTIPHEGRTIRVSILSVNLVAVSNTTDPAIIRGMIDRHLKIALPFGGAQLLRDHYRHVPIGSSAWAIVSLPSPEGRAMTLPLPNGIEFQLPAKTVTVASLRYLGAIQFKAESFTANAADAKQLTDSLTNFLQLFRAVESNVQTGGPDRDVKAFFDSLKVEQHNTRSVLTAELPAGFIQKAMTDAPTPAAPPADPKSEPAPAPKAKGKKN